MNQQTNKQVTAQKKKIAKFHADVSDVMKTNQGRDVLNYFIMQSGYGQPAFKGATNETIYNTGLQALGLQIVEACQAASPDLHLKMISERLNGR